MEIWKDIPGYESFYQVSNMGKIRGLIRGRRKKGIVLKPILDSYGYHKVNLSKDGIVKKWFIHRLVMAAFAGYNPKQVDHINGIKTDNRVENLEYVTGRENQLRAKKRIGTKSKYRGVSWHPQNGKWQSEIQINNIRHYIGIFNAEEEAAEAYNKVLLTVQHADK